jgi:hypothetical protein
MRPLLPPLRGNELVEGRPATADPGGGHAVP